MDFKKAFFDLLQETGIPLPEGFADETSEEILEAYSIYLRQRIRASSDKTHNFIAAMLVNSKTGEAVMQEVVTDLSFLEWRRDQIPKLTLSGKGDMNIIPQSVFPITKADHDAEKSFHVQRRIADRKPLIKG